MAAIRAARSAQAGRERQVVSRGTGRPAAAREADLSGGLPCAYGSYLIAHIVLSCR
ncbi:hypothetical protein OHS81_33005 [Streptomyces sp. NBC_00400]|uniref:hypothetical protein n=1 Tax=Streptomyces sp. NBC_00400 TaxID=2975737 RepID=UPI002E23AF60